MAVTKITAQSVGVNCFKMLALSPASSASDGFALDWDGQDERMAVVLENGGSAAATVTVKAGNGIQGVNDLAAYSVAAGSVAVGVLESGAFKNVSGDSKGKVILIPSSTDVKVGLVKLY